MGGAGAPAIQLTHVAHVMIRPPLATRGTRGTGPPVAPRAAARPRARPPVRECFKLGAQAPRARHIVGGEAVARLRVPASSFEEKKMAAGQAPLERPNRAASPGCFRCRISRENCRNL